MADLQAQEGAAQVLSDPAAATPPAAPQEGPHTEAPNTLESVNTDIPMVDASSAADHASPAPSIQPPLRTGTPSRTNGAAAPDKEPGSSRANSVHPEPKEPLPDLAAEHGEPVRRYLNSKVSGALLEGMRMIAKEQPNDPLRVLGEFLIKRQQELDSAGTA